MHVYVRIWMYLHVYCCFHLWPLHQLPATSYMYVYVRISCICMYMRYMHVLCSYMHVFPAITPQDTGNDATSPKHLLKGQQSAGHIQRIPGPHLSIHFFSHLANVAQTRFGAPHPLHASRAPEASLPLAAGRSPMHDPLTAIQSRDLSHQIWLVGAHPDAPGRRPPPLQNTTLLQFVDVTICMYIYINTIYACIHMYMYVYMTLPKSMLVYFFICMYMHVYAYMHVYIFKRVIYVKNGCDYDSHPGTVAEVITFHCGDGCSRPENAKGVLHHFESLFAIEFQERPSSPVLWFPCRALEERRNEKPLYTYIYIHILYIGVCICMYIVRISLFLDV